MSKDPVGDILREGWRQIQENAKVGVSQERLTGATQMLIWIGESLGYQVELTDGKQTAPENAANPQPRRSKTSKKTGRRTKARKSGTAV